jgi:nitrite reductase/ring-hydroxylating ferredoxin subunit
MPKVEYPLTAVDAIPVEGSALVEFFGRQIHVVRGVDGAPAAFMNVCMHFGGTLGCADGEFRCEWHGATFDARTGERTSGPASEGSRLMLLPTEIRDGTVVYVYAWCDDAG